jgi:hypothetical protein
MPFKIFIFLKKYKLKQIFNIAGTGMCVLCSLSLTNCNRCVDKDTCIECAPEYSIDLDNKCVKCETSLFLNFETTQFSSGIRLKRI